MPGNPTLAVQGPAGAHVRRANRPQIAASDARALGPWGTLVLPFEQPLRMLIHLQHLPAIEIGWQASDDLTSEAMQSREAA